MVLQAAERLPGGHCALGGSDVACCAGWGLCSWEPACAWGLVRWDWGVLQTQELSDVQCHLGDVVRS